MTIQQVIDLAKAGELRQLYTGDDIAVLGYLNLGLIELYKRFALLTNEVVITLQDGVEIYTLPTDCMWIIGAYDEVPETSSQTVIEIPINEEDNPLSINTVSWNQIQVPVSATGSYISIIYAASPTYVTDTASTLQLPSQLLEALLHYIGYRAHGAVDGNVQAENNTHYQRFEASCNRVKAEGMFTSDDFSLSERISIKGLV